MPRPDHHRVRFIVFGALSCLVVASCGGDVRFTAEGSVRPLSKSFQSLDVTVHGIRKREEDICVTFTAALRATGNHGERAVADVKYRQWYDTFENDISGTAVRGGQEVTPERFREFLSFAGPAVTEAEVLEAMEVVDQVGAGPKGGPGKLLQFTLVRYSSKYDP